MIRTPARDRFEDRSVDGSANPYLAAAVILASGLDGIENKIDPGEPNVDNLYEVPEAEIRRRGIRTLPGEPAGRDPQPRRRPGPACRARPGRRARTTSTTSSG